MNRTMKVTILLGAAAVGTWIVSQTLGVQPPPRPAGPALEQRSEHEGWRLARREEDEGRCPDKRGEFRLRRPPRDDRWAQRRLDDRRPERRPEGFPAMGPGGPMRPRPMPIEHAERMEQMLQLIKRMERVCFEPSTAGLIAVGGLKDEVPRRPGEIIEDLENVLSKTRTLGLRNAIRLTLKDLYKMQGNGKMVLKHLRAMVAENDEEMRKAEAEEHERQEEDRDD